MQLPIEELEKKQKTQEIFPNVNIDVPHIIKYMGSKRNILGSILEGINQFDEFNEICDLFAGTSVLAGALRNSFRIHSNDIQEYSSIFANTYLADLDVGEKKNILGEIKDKSKRYVSRVKQEYPDLKFEYLPNMNLKEFNHIEKLQQQLIKSDFSNLEYHLFLKYYSGTYWSYEQCIWIDALRKVADEYKGTSLYFVILSSLMFAMSYNSQSTGHYAQYRDATNDKSKSDILIYRTKKILPYFSRKFIELVDFLGGSELSHKVTSLDYRKCLDIISSDTLVYADPPYCFVHYSRFYHALETLVKYDYPDINFKGRYREERHQSPFCKKTEVQDAFKKLFEKISKKDAQLLLSYSDNGLIKLEEIFEIASSCINSNYKISESRISHLHSTMGRDDEKNINVKEHLIFIKK